MLSKLLLSSVLPLSLMGSVASAQETRYLVVGGGNHATHSQVALETNMKLFANVAKQYLVPNEMMVRLFGAGTDKSVPDVLVKRRGVPVELELFSKVFDLDESPSLSVRHNELQNIDASATKSNVLSALERENKLVDDQGKLRFYYTGHGAVDRFRDDRFLVTWEDESETSNMLFAKEFTRELDAFPATTQVQTVMVQCFSGGFANMNFVGGDRDARVLSPANRCGFFSQLATRYAAGCSPDLDQREEYSPYFFAAYAGKTEKGESVDADFNRDGKVTSNEAHAFVILNENSFDVPISTSSDLLRAYFRTGSDALGLTWSDFAARMDSVELAVAKGLASKLGVDLEAEQPLIPEITKTIQKLRVEMQRAQNDEQLESYRFGRIANQVRRAVLMAYQKSEEAEGHELTGRVELDMEKLAKLFSETPQLQELLSAYDKLTKAGEATLAAERDKAKWERLQYLLQTKYMEKLLANSGESDLVAKYQQLKTCESASFFE